MSSRCGSSERDVLAQILPSSLGRGSKLQGPPPIALTLLYSITVWHQYNSPLNIGKPSSLKSFREVGGREREVGGRPLSTPQGVFPSNRGGTEPNRNVTYTVLKDTASNRCTTSLLPR
ncbi:hypothetical protein TNCV_428991 [Trichonephila clavipes]|nr:hypothetical protein TNCV_428991 [Trichonephila clavipes]